MNRLTTAAITFGTSYSVIYAAVSSTPFWATLAKVGGVMATTSVGGMLIGVGTALIVRGVRSHKKQKLRERGWAPTSNVPFVE